MIYIVNIKIGYIDATLKFFNSEDALSFMADMRKIEVKPEEGLDREFKMWLTIEEEDF